MMYEYTGKTTNRRINKNWVFWTNGKLYEEDMVKLGVGRGLEESDFVSKDKKPVVKKEVPVEEPKAAPKKAVYKPKVKSKSR